MRRLDWLSGMNESDNVSASMAKWSKLAPLCSVSEAVWRKHPAKLYSVYICENYEQEWRAAQLAMNQIWQISLHCKGGEKTKASEISFQPSRLLIFATDCSKRIHRMLTYGAILHWKLKDCKHDFLFLFFEKAAPSMAMNHEWHINAYWSHSKGRRFHYRSCMNHGSITWGKCEYVYLALYCPIAYIGYSRMHL